MSKPRVIFLDAVGTLFGVKGSVGQVYSDFAKRFGVVAAVNDVDRAFYKSFKTAPAMAFPTAPKTDVPHLEYLWWKKVAQQTFARLELLPKFTDFETFFTEVYQHFATADPWLLYPDTMSSIARWQRQDIELGIISNFDSRLHSVLTALDLIGKFQSVTISTEVGVAKPDSLIFITALQKHQAAATEAWHIGDSYDEDFLGAQSAGLKGIWIKRQGLYA
ncbi:MAG: HAD-IA family hydrolase [Cyanobacteria bacterium P01_A01_bin.114]